MLNETQQNEQKLNTNSLSPEKVRQVTEKVYARLLREVKIENERRRLRSPYYRRR